jgi:hypothetical protein
MTVELEDEGVRATIRKVGAADCLRMRLTLDYPINEQFQDRVLNALSDIIRPASSATCADASKTVAP